MTQVSLNDQENKINSSADIFRFTAGGWDFFVGRCVYWSDILRMLAVQY